MRRLRESWLALGGSALIIALSVSSALGADPDDDPLNVGQQVSEFAQSLNGQNQDGDEPDGDDAEGTEDGDEADLTLEPGDEDFDWTTVSHGFCVSWHAHEDETAEENLPEDGEDWQNHGEFVSHWARVGCNESPDDTADADEADEDADVADEEGTEDGDEADLTLEPGDEGFDWTTVSHGFCVSWHAHEDETTEENLPEDGGDWANHGEFVNHWARAGCNESPDEADAEDADATAAEDEDGEGAEKGKKEKKNNGNGRGRGRGGRP